MHNQTQNIY